MSIIDFITQKLEKAKNDGLYRELLPEKKGIDFFSNDYLGFARSKMLKLITENILNDFNEKNVNGSSGSRLISGNYRFTEELEEYIAAFHKAEAALIFNSGYDANLGLFSCLPQRGDTILYDELIHASIRDGIRLSYANAWSFGHNDLNELEQLLSKAKGNVFVATESVFSMDGDIAPLAEMCKLCERYNAALIVDEAHSSGYRGNCGEGLVVELGLENKVFARVHTFGKALGAHGAAVVCDANLRKFLINFSRPFIFTTALPAHSYAMIKAAYTLLNENPDHILRLKTNLACFDKYANEFGIAEFLPSTSPIKPLMIKGNENADRLSEYLFQRGFLVKAVKSPTVPKGKERLRITIHSFNTEEEIRTLLTDIKHSGLL